MSFEPAVFNETRCGVFWRRVSWHFIGLWGMLVGGAIMKRLSNEILRDLDALLAYHQAVGIDSYPLSPGIKSFLERSALPARKPVMPSAAVVVSSKRNAETRRVVSEDCQVVSQEFRAIERDIASCERCSLAEMRSRVVVGSGEVPVRLLVVGDWLSFEASHDLERHLVFGEEQDLMLDRMLTAIKLSRKDVYVTNIIKCALSSGRQPNTAETQTCYSYLERQIVLLKPELILVMGVLPARIMLKSKAPLVRLRGRFHQFIEPGGRAIPLLATYHPSFLLRNSEMKKATWEDLKRVAKQLGLS